MNTGRTDNRAITITVPDSTTGERLDRYLAEHPDLDLTRSRLVKLITDRLVTVNGHPQSKNYRVTGGDVIALDIPPPARRDVTPENIPLDVVYEDNHLAVINKPAGLVTHPGAGNYTGTLVNAIMYRFENLAHGSATDRPGIVHRLDKNTSGLLVVARNDDIYLALQKQLQARAIHRTYTALVCGHVKEETGVIDAPIGRSLCNRKKMAVTDLNSRPAVTRYRLTQRYRTYDLLDIELETGRTHQIRVHLAHPVSYTHLTLPTN